MFAWGMGLFICTKPMAKRNQHAKKGFNVENPLDSIHMGPDKHIRLDSNAPDDADAPLRVFNRAYNDARYLRVLENFSFELTVISDVSGTVTATWYDANNVEYNVTNAAVTFLGTPTATNFRWDLIKLNFNGTVTVISGVESANPERPTEGIDGIIGGELIWNDLGQYQVVETIIIFPNDRYQTQININNSGNFAKVLSGPITNGQMYSLQLAYTNYSSDWTNQGKGDTGILNVTFLANASGNSINTDFVRIETISGNSEAGDWILVDAIGGNWELWHKSKAYWGRTQFRVLFINDVVNKDWFIQNAPYMASIPANDGQFPSVVFGGSGEVGAGLSIDGDGNPRLGAEDGTNPIQYKVGELFQLFLEANEVNTQSFVFNLNESTLSKAELYFQSYFAYSEENFVEGGLRSFLSENTQIVKLNYSGRLDETTIIFDNFVEFYEKGIEVLRDSDLDNSGPYQGLLIGNTPRKNTNERIAFIDEILLRGAGDAADYSATKQALDYVTKMMLDAGLATKAGSSHTHIASNITDFNTAVAANSAVTANTAKVSNATHTGDVTGSVALTIANAVVTLPKMANLAANSIIGNNTGSAATPIALTPAQVRALLNVSESGSENIIVSNQVFNYVASNTVTLNFVPDGVLYVALNGQLTDRWTRVGDQLTVTDFTEGYIIVSYYDNLTIAAEITIPMVTGLVEALASKLEAASIENFENTSQLNTRDTNNRNRANHTGTQAPSTIEQNASNRFVTDTEKATWNAKADNPTRKTALTLETDCYGNTAGTSFAPFLGAAQSSGAVAVVASEVNHPGIVALRDSTTANGGYRIITDISSILIGGGERHVSTWQIRNARAGIRIHIGFFDILTSGDPTDCVCLVGTADGTTITLTPRARANNTAQNLTAFTPDLNTWYTSDITINSDATEATIRIFTDDGTEVFTSGTLTNIPTAAGRQTGAGVSAFESSTDAAADILWLDYMRLEINRTLVR
jgi:hypothetical protein